MSTSNNGPRRPSNQRRRPSDQQRRAAGSRDRSVASTRKPSDRPQNSSGRRASSRQRIRRKSRYYRRRQRQKRIIMGIGLLLILLLLILIFRGCSGCGKDKNSAKSLSTATNTSAKTNSDTEQSPDVSPSPTPMPPVSLTVSVVGDCTLGTDDNFDYDTSLNAYYYSYGKEYFLSNVKSIFSSDDLTIANFEGALTDSYDRQDKLFAFKAPAEFAGILSSGSVEAVNLANNHTYDYGEEGFADTLSALESENIVHFGYDETAVIDIKGIKVGLVGIYELYDHMEREDQLKANIAKVKAEGAQLIIVIFHWGNEKETVPDSNQLALGKIAIDEGAHLVCGHHPHVLQGIDQYKGRNVVYSLGNFCFGGNSAPSDMDSMIFQQTFTIDSSGVKMDNVINIIPCSISSEYYYNNYQPTPAKGDEADRIMNKIEERSSWIG